MRPAGLFLSILILIILASAKLDKPAYVIYNKEGKSQKYRQLLDGLSDADIILFGEIHNDPIAHWLELSVEKDLFNRGKSLLLGSEMFEADEQLILDEYMEEIIPVTNFEKEAKLWDNYRTDYKPLLDFAREKKIKWIATDIPRRYAAIVSRKGFAGLDSLSGEAKKYIAPLPVAYDPDLPCYKNMRDMMDMHTQAGMSFNPDYFSEAQAIKDATMAYFILKNYNKGQCFLHFNGAYHSNNFEGIVWYLKKADPSLRILTVNVVEQDDPEKLEEANKNSADYIIAVPSDMTKTY